MRGADTEHVRTTDAVDQHYHPADHAIDVVAGAGVVIPTGRLHHVDIGGPVTFALEFHREHDRTDPAADSESGGLALF